MDYRPTLEFTYHVRAETRYSQTLLEKFPPGGPWELEGFNLSLDGSKLYAGTDDYDDENEARATLENLLDRWFRRIALENAYLSYRFEDMVDNRHEKPLRRVERSFQAGRMIVSPSQGPLPGPPDSPDLYVSTTLSETVERCVREIQDEIDLGGNVYHISTAVASGARQRDRDVKTLYSISDGVLEDMTNISSKRDPKHGRKVVDAKQARGRNITPDRDYLSPEEVEYLNKAGLVVGKRFLEVEYGLPPGQKITRADLPHLPKKPKVS